MMSNMENNKDLLSVLWGGADILRSKMDANEYKNYLLGMVFYKYLSDTFLVRAYDLINDCKPNTMEQAQEAYEEFMESDSGEDLMEDIMETYRYAIKPEHTFTKFVKKVNESTFKREDLQAAFNAIEDSDEIFHHMFDDIDLYSNRLGAGDAKQSKTISDLILEINKADLLKAEGDVLGNAYEYLIGQFASETGKKAGEFYTPQGPAQILTRIAVAGQEGIRGLTVYDITVTGLIQRTWERVA